ncbi:MAG TPA: HAMP domain-containing sensor histidine kinase [Gemmatimonadaceae bacterium]|nr:HAMP domain-containing sensor histidine kinase [Gemmatimonadaceae bacterium]
MAISRLRLRLSTAYAVSFVGALALVSLSSLGFLWRRSHTRLERRLQRTVASVSSLQESAGAASSAQLPALESSVARISLVMVDAAGAVTNASNSAVPPDTLAQLWTRLGKPERFAFPFGDQDYQAAARRISIGTPSGNGAVIAFASTEGIEDDLGLLAEALAIAAPVIVLLSLGGGYFLAGRALSPIRDLERSISAIAPSDPGKRLDVRSPADEIDAVASEFNSLLGRFEQSQLQNRGFVRETAHQIRTPLTLVFGEAANQLSAQSPSVDAMRATLGRIQTAAEQIGRRVDDLTLLATAQAGEAVRREDDVSLDALVTQCADLMRARATALGHTIALGTLERVEFRAHEGLLREAVVELMENSCRHGAAGSVVTVSVESETTFAIVQVTSTGKPFSLPVPTREPSRLGLPIVMWIAGVHGGELTLSRVEDRNTLSLRLSRG